jgi:hypothetical protein
VSYVQSFARGIGEEVKAVEFGLFLCLAGCVEAFFFPELLPFGFDFMRVICRPGDVVLFRHVADYSPLLIKNRSAWGAPILYA